MSTAPYFDLFTRGEHHVVTYAAGEPVFHAGEAAECLFVVRRGSVLLHDGDRELETVTAGGIFGEMALVDGLGRSASATAATDSELVLLDERRFQYLLQETPFFAQAVMRVMAERLRQNKRS
jgi:CRP-like cAMP-binding protein